MDTAIEKTLYFVAQKGWVSSSQEFFTSLVTFLGQTLEIEYALVDELLDDGQTARTVGLYAAGDVVPNMEYKLAGTPCEHVMGKSLCFYPAGVQELFPEDKLLTEMGARSYIGTPLWDSKGDPIGLIAVLGTTEFTGNRRTAEAVLQIVAVRCAHELERAAAERETRRFRDFYGTILAHIRDGLWVTDPKERFVYLNPGTERIAGVKAQEVLGSDVTRDFRTARARPFLERYRQAREDRVPLPYEAEVVPPIRQPGTLSGWLIPRFDDETYEGMICTIQDLSAQKKAERALRESERKYRTLVENLPDLIVRYDRNLRRTYVNPAWEEASGLSATDVVNVPPEVIPHVPNPTVEAYLNALRAVLAGGERRSLEFTWVNARGKTLHLEYRLVPEHDTDGNVIGVLSVGYDATERMLAAADLRESERRLAQAQRMAHVGYWERDFTAGTIDLSLESCRIFGISPDDVPVGLEQWHQRWTELIHPEDQPRTVQAAADALRNGPPYKMEYRVVRPDGGLRFVHSEAVVEWDKAGRPISMLGMMQDITERKEAEKAVHRLNQELEQRVAMRTAELEAANKELEAFAYSVSHDLRAPLRHIDGYMGLLRQHFGTGLNEQGRRYMDMTSEAAQRMGQLIDDLLSFSRMGRAEMTEETVALGPLVAEVVDELAPEAVGREVDWRVSRLPEVVGDRALLKIVFSNLLSNALKFTQPRDPAEIEVGWRPEKHKGHTEIAVFVHDNGVGFDPDYADNLFGVFQRLHRAEEFEGTGIGLATVRRIVARHGGRTWAEGTLGRGATFHFSLPSAVKNDPL